MLVIDLDVVMIIETLTLWRVTAFVLVVHITRDVCDGWTVMAIFGGAKGRS